jgi:hypothetical protein
MIEQMAAISEARMMPMLNSSQKTLGGDTFDNSDDMISSFLFQLEEVTMVPQETMISLCRRPAMGQQ